MPLEGGLGGLKSTWKSGVQFTLFQAGGGGQIMHHITACLPGFENLTASLRLPFLDEEK